MQARGRGAERQGRDPEPAVSEHPGSRAGPGTGGSAGARLGPGGWRLECVGGCAKQDILALGGVEQVLQVKEQAQATDRAPSLPALVARCTT